MTWKYWASFACGCVYARELPTVCRHSGTTPVCASLCIPHGCGVGHREAAECCCVQRRHTCRVHAVHLTGIHSTKPELAIAAADEEWTVALCKEVMTVAGEVVAHAGQW